MSSESSAKISSLTDPLSLSILAEEAGGRRLETGGWRLEIGGTMEREVRVERMRPQQLVAERERAPLVYLPVGPLEWHGPHLPYGVDAMNAREAALRVARETGGVVLPTLYLGTERERTPEMLRSMGFEGGEYIVGMDFPANSLPSYYFPEEVLAVMVRSYLDLLIEHGYKLVVLMNGHGAENQIGTLQRLAVEYTHEKPIRVLLLMPIPGFTRADWSYAHATEGETSVMQAVAPETVDLEALPDSGPLRNVDFAVVDDKTFRLQPTEDHTVRPEEDPRRASAENGERRLRACTEELVAAVKAEMRRA